MSNSRKLRIVIPTFNRACQLECLLRSIFDNCASADQFSICAFYRFTDDAFASGYEIVQEQFPTVQFVQQSFERSFKQQFLDLMDDSDFFGIIVDDMVVLDGFGPTDHPFALLRSREDLFSLSLRLDGAKTFSQPMHRPDMPPVFDKDLVWRWKPRLSRNFRITRFLDKTLYRSPFYDWGFPCPLDGTVYRTNFFRKFFETLDEFENIPFIEKSFSDALRRFKNAPPNMIRYPTTKSISLAMNSVDAFHDYPSLGLDPRQFNDRFVAGERLDYTPFQKIILHACHIVTEPFWLPRS